MVEPLVLNGKSDDAVALFTNLLADFPDDFEVKLNYAESLLWNKKYDNAKSYYEKLIEENDQSFSALLGYANTLSNLKMFEDALVNVDKALAVLPGNPNALVSKKYMRLGLANDKVNIQSYKEAEAILKENFENFEKDKETLLNLANLYLVSKQIEKAKETYLVIGENKENSFISLNGISLAYHLEDDNKAALKISEHALSLLTKETPKEFVKQTFERYVQALIWNKKFSIADTEIKELINVYGKENWVLSLRATLLIYKSDFKKSVADYNAILKKDSASFDGNLGKANALKALGFYNKAYKSANNTLVFYKNQKDALNFIKTLDQSFSPFLETTASYSFDNGKNEAYSYTANSEVHLSTKFKVTGSYNYRTTLNNTIDIKAISNNFSAGISYQLSNSIIFSSTVGVSSSTTKTNNFNQLLTDITFKMKPFKLQNLDIGYKREVENFNAALLDREIVKNNAIVNYSLSTNFRLGWFSQYYYTWQNDENKRNLLFTSLYYNLLEKPSLKAGLNYQYIAFADQVPTIYFSPSKFNAVEVFFNMIKNEVIAKEKECFYDLTGAIGYQYIEDDEPLSTYRIQGKLGYKFSDRAMFNIYGTQSNIASATAAGFTFTEFGVRFKWNMSSKPWFKKVD